MGNVSEVDGVMQKADQLRDATFKLDLSEQISDANQREEASILAEAVGASPSGEAVMRERVRRIREAIARLDVAESVTNATEMEKACLEVEAVGADNSPAALKGTHILYAIARLDAADKSDDAQEIEEACRYAEAIGASPPRLALVRDQERQVCDAPIWLAVAKHGNIVVEEMLLERDAAGEDSYRLSDNPLKEICTSASALLHECGIAAQEMRAACLEAGAVVAEEWLVAVNRNDAQDADKACLEAEVAGVDARRVPDLTEASAAELRDGDE
jgi:hypothetical protein